MFFPPGLAPQGPTGATGATGPTGDTGPAAVAGKIPNAYVELTSPVGTTSATLEDVTGMSAEVTIAEPVEILATASFEIATQSGAAPSTIGVALNIDGTDYDEYQRYLSGTSDTGIGAITHSSKVPLSAGNHTVKLRFKRAAGVATPGLNKADLTVMAMQGAQGAPVAISGATSSDVSLSTDASTAVLAQTLTGNGLAASKSYVGTIGVRVTVWPTAALDKASQFDARVGVVITTDGSAIATVTFLTTAVFDKSLAHADLTSVECAIAASTGGFTISATRPADVACKAAAEWYVSGANWREVTT